MKNTIERITQQMTQASCSHKLPKAYTEDLEMDFNDLPKYLEQGIDVIWILRSYGTVMVPMGIGADPSYVTSWLWRDHGQQIKTFHISKEGVRPVSFEEAESLMMRHPAQLSTLDSIETIREAVDAVLRRGTEMRIWGIWDAVRLEQFSGLVQWHRHFSNANNCVMADFTAKALRLIQSKRGGSNAYAA